MRKVLPILFLMFNLIPLSLQAIFLVNPAIMPALIALIRNEQLAIHFAMYTFTHPLITEELKKASARGVSVSGVLDLFSQEVNQSQTKELVNDPKIDILQYQSRESGGTMHDKFWMFHANTSCPKRIITAGIVHELQVGTSVQSYLLGGSCNMTKRAVDKNAEHMLLRSDKEEFESLQQHFKWLCSQSFKLSNYASK